MIHLSVICDKESEIVNKTQKSFSEINVEINLI